VPVLKGKKGDIAALKHLKSDSRALVTPVIELSPPDNNSTITRRISTAIGGLSQAWTDGSFFADLKWLASSPVVEGEAHPVLSFAKLARVNFLRSIPVTSIDRDPAYQQATRDVVGGNDSGMASRLVPDHFESTDVAVFIDRLLSFVSLGPSMVDVVLDFGSVSTVGAGMLARMMRELVSGLPHLTEWRTLTVAGGSFPASLVAVGNARKGVPYRDPQRGLPGCSPSTGLPHVFGPLGGPS